MVKEISTKEWFADDSNDKNPAKCVAEPEIKGRLNKCCPYVVFGEPMSVGLSRLWRRLERVGGIILTCTCVYEEVVVTYVICDVQ